MILRAGLLLIATLLCATPAVAQGAAPDLSRFSVAPEVAATRGLKLRADSRYLDFLRPGMTFPLVLDLEATGQAFRGTVEVQMAGNPVLVVPVEVEAPSHQRLVLTPQAPVAPLTGAWGNQSQVPELELRLKSGGRTVQEVKLPWNIAPFDERSWGEATAQTPLLASFRPMLQMESPANGLHLQYLSNMRGGKEVGFFLPPMQPFYWPVPAEGFASRDAWAPLDVLLLHGVEPRDWTAEKREALQQWVLSGGALLIWPGVGTSWNPLGPLGMGGIEEQVASRERPVGTAAALGELVATPLANPALPVERFPLPDSFRVLVEAADGAPLLGWRRYGRGCVVYATVSLGLQDFRAGDFLPALLQWMADWALSHSVADQRHVGAAAESSSGMGTMSSFHQQRQMSYGYQEQGTYIDPAARMAIPMAHYGFLLKEGMTWPVKAFIGVYLLCLLVLYPFWRQPGRWQLAGVLWSLMLGLAVLTSYIPWQPTRSSHANLTVSFPAAPAQQMLGSVHRAQRGRFRNVIDPGLNTTNPRAVQLPAWIPMLPQDHQGSPYRHYLLDTDYQMRWQRTGEVRAQGVDLPLQSRRAFFGWGPLQDPQQPVTLRLTGDERLVVEMRNLELEANYVVAIASIGGAVVIGDGPVENATAVLRMQAEPPPDTYGYGGLSTPIRQYPNPLESEQLWQPWHPDAPEGDWTRRSRDVRLLAGPLKEWVQYGGGVGVLALHFPDPKLHRPIEGVLWFDPDGMDSLQPADQTGWVIRAGSSRGFMPGSLSSFSDAKSPAEFREPGWLDLHANRNLTGPSSIYARATGVSVQPLVLQQYRVGEGWTICPERVSPHPDYQAWVPSEPGTMFRLNAPARCIIDNLGVR